MKLFLDMFMTAVYSVFVQNLVFSGGYGMSEAIRISAKPSSFGAFAGIISGFSIVTSAICALIEGVWDFSAQPNALSAAVYGAVLFVVYIAVALIVRYAFKASRQLLSTLGIAALNTLVLAIPAINHRAAYSFAGCIGSGLGAGIAFVLAAALISKGAYYISENDDIPELFKGTPAMFLYVGLLSLAFAGFSGSSIFT